MKKIGNSSLRGLFVAALLAAAGAAGVARADVRDDRVISARAGGVNFVSGDVSVRRAGGKEWRRVSAHEDLKSGDVVRTGDAGRVEVLLNPGSYFRAGERTEFEFAETSLESLRLRLLSGSAVVEATGYGELDLDIRIATPQTIVRIVRTGVYRVDVTPAGETVVAVQKGRALVGPGAAEQRVKGGKVARAGAGGVEVAKLEKKERDQLDLWSRERGRELAKVNEKLARSRQANTMLASFNSPFGISSDFYRDRFGLWMWSAPMSCYTFLPFYAGWRSPYGVGYGSFFPVYAGGYNCYGCPQRNRGYIRDTNPIYTPSPGGGGVGTATPSPGGGAGGGSNGGVGVRSPNPLPPMPRGGDRVERPIREGINGQGPRRP